VSYFVRMPLEQMTESSGATPLQTFAPAVFVTGKGGVGKTTIAAALALLFQDRGLRTALVEFEDGEAGIRALSERRDDISHLVLTYDRALVETLAAVLHAKILAKALVSHGTLKRLIRAVPALREFAFMDRVRDLVQSGRFDHVVVDLPASGHALDWLRVPQAFERFLGRSPLGLMGRNVHEALVATGRSDVVVVTLAEPLVVKETEQLCQRMRSELSMIPALVVVNRTVEPDPDGAWEAVQFLAGNVPHLGLAAADFAEILQSRGDQSDDTTYAFGLARALDATRVVALPEAAHDPSASTVASWLRNEGIS
jgi:anion-transporting  ArsA/GET3 family ATPase